MSNPAGGTPRPGAAPHPFAELIGLVHRSASPGQSVMALTPRPEHLNPNHVVHGAVLYAMADVGMGAALSHTLAEGELCATIQITMNYFKPVTEGLVVCSTEVVNRGRRIANLRSLLMVDGVRVASADGNYAIFKPGVA